VIIDAALSRKLRGRRRGVAGILAALIMFAMVFTAGTGFFLTINSLKHNSDQALASRLSAMSQESQENMSVRVKVIAGGNLVVVVNNTGSVPSTIVDLFVTNPRGSLVSSYLSSSPQLNVTLPVSLPVGASTSMISGCTGKVGCNIRISSTAFTGGTSAFLVSVLTKVGNVFTVQYPTPLPLTYKNIILFTQNQVVEVDQGGSVINQNNESVVVGCYGCNTNLAAGGNILLAQVIATPSPVSAGATITVTGTVWNYSPYTASGVNFTLRGQYSGSASVLPDISTSSSKCGPTGTVAPGTSTVFTCSFTAKTTGGSTGGTVTFSGQASACILTGNTTTCNNGVLASSAIATSNPVQVGTIVSFGPWQLNYYYFTYTDKTHQSASSPAIIVHSDQYVALFVQLTNIYNSSLTVLDGSYLQFVSPGSDVNAYIVENGTISYTSNTFQNYGCIDSPPAAPLDLKSGQNCIKVAPGQTVTLAFAADAPYSTSWEWGTGGNPGGDSNVGCTVQIIIEYTLARGASYGIYAEDVPFQSVFIQ